MKPYTESEPVFSESIQVTEPTDPAHADNINAGPKQLLQNTLVNKKEIEDLKQGNNEVEFDDTVIPGEGEEPEGVPDPAEALEQITSGKSVPVLIGHIKRTLTGLLSLSQRALNIAMGKNQARVFATVDALDAWLAVPENVAELKVGDNFYVAATDVPDYWWDGSAKQELEVQKVDLTAYDRKIAALEAKDSELNENITALETKITSFEQTKSEIVASGLGTALGLIASNTWAQIVAKLKNVVNRGAWNGSISASGGNVTVPAGYHNGSGKVTGPTLAALVGTGVSLASAASLLSGVTAYGRNGTKYTGTHVCRTLAQLVGSNVNLDNNARLLSGYTAYGKNGVKYTGNITDLSNTIDYATTDAGDQSHSCYRVNGTSIEVVPRKGYWGNWNWEASCIRVPTAGALGTWSLKSGTFYTVRTSVYTGSFTLDGISGSGYVLAIVNVHGRVWGDAAGAGGSEPGFWFGSSNGNLHTVIWGRWDNYGQTQKPDEAAIGIFLGYLSGAGNATLTASYRVISNPIVSGLIQFFQT